ncbi:ferredoxin [Comamonas testosteroni]|uniref:Ferredoxin n=1 Tax=Comamonas testosteroni TaxID=285 RepID=A0A0L7MB71_COMTE|nr:PDR/VanB family oxidoreductase [Comamonas testosteroni]KOC19155.1 ferredoxin [Comamonas testosteroni]KWT74724.1 Flavodoxin reductases (ferredoxin-NADPH reductases) family 1 [Comamonas testosteroni]
MLELVVQRRVQEAEDIISLDFISAQGMVLPAFAPGAHIDLHLPNGLIRQYSLCHPSESQSSGKYTIAVQREKESRGGSISVHEQLTVGSRVQASEPRNLFELVPAARKHLLLAGGIGITPLICMAQALALKQHEFELHYFCRSQARAAFGDLLRSESLARSVRLHLDGNADVHLAEILKRPDSDTHIYVCGPSGFMDCVLATASERDWPSSNVHKEFFAVDSSPQEGDQLFEVQIASTGRRYEIPVGASVFEVLDQAGLDIPVSCEQGICGTCVTQVLDGIPDHRDQYLTDAEKATNKCFTPCCSRAHSKLLVLDL